MKFDKELFKAAIIETRCNLQKQAERNLGLREIGKLAGISASTLSRLLRCDKSDIDTIMLVCTWMNRPITEFVQEEKPVQIIPDSLKSALDGLRSFEENRPDGKMFSSVREPVDGI